MKKNGHLSISDKELSRYYELQQIHEKRQTIAPAAQTLDLSLRQVKRLKSEVAKDRHPRKLELHCFLLKKSLGFPSNLGDYGRNCFE